MEGIIEVRPERYSYAAIHVVATKVANLELVERVTTCIWIASAGHVLLFSLGHLNYRHRGARVKSVIQKSCNYLESLRVFQI